MRVPEVGIGRIGPLVLAAAALHCAGAPVAPSALPVPAFTEANELIFPEGYREWIYLSSGMGMTYRKSGEVETSEPRFDNVFVSPAAYRAYLETGRWSESTIFVLEVRSSRTHGSINQGGRFQGGREAIEAEVKNARFPGKWTFFTFETGPGDDVAPRPARALPSPSACSDCHQRHGAVEQTFVQFYPTLYDVAARLHTLNPGYHSEPPDEGEEP